MQQRDHACLHFRPSLLPWRRRSPVTNCGAKPDANAHARGLPGPTGRYRANVEIAGVRGQLIKCEMDAVHTYVFFTSPSIEEDIIIDVTYKQFLVITDWMGDTPDSHHYQVSRVTPLTCTRLRVHVYTTYQRTAAAIVALFLRSSDPHL